MHCSDAARRRRSAHPGGASGPRRDHDGPIRKRNVTTPDLRPANEVFAVTVAAGDR